MGSLRFFDLKGLQLRHDAKTFIETGTGYGHGVEYAQTIGFESIYSIEIFEKIVNDLTPKFANDKRVKLVRAPSIEGLNKIVGQIKGNAIFFLDSHFPGADVGGAGFGDEKDEDLRLPLLREMRFVKKNRLDKGFKDIILIDDLMIFDEENVYPDQEWKNKLDISPRKDKNCWKQILNMFSQTHAAQVFKENSGYVIFSPKE